MRWATDLEVPQADGLLRDDAEQGAGARGQRGQCGERTDRHAAPAPPRLEQRCLVRGPGWDSHGDLRSLMEAKSSLQKSRTQIDVHPGSFKLQGEVQQSGATHQIGGRLLLRPPQQAGLDRHRRSPPSRSC